jgi:hypothetical protein
MVPTRPSDASQKRKVNGQSFIASDVDNHLPAFDDLTAMQSYRLKRRIVHAQRIRQAVKLRLAGCQHIIDVAMAFIRRAKVDFKRDIIHVRQNYAPVLSHLVARLNLRRLAFPLLYSRLRRPM